MKKCTKCGQEKEVTEFFVKDKKSGRLHTQCKLCYKEHRKTYHLQHYAKYGDLYRQRAKIRREKVREILHQQMAKYLEDKKCQICGENDPRVLDFDHLDPKQKTISVARAVSNGAAWSDILLEIKKCRILCSNCHRKHTADQFGWYKNGKNFIA